MITRLATAQRPTNLAVARRVQNYRWEDGIDPAMQELCDLIIQSGLSIHEVTKQVRSVSGGQVNIGWGTIDNWLGGKTKKPQNFTLTWVGFALGYERAWKKL